MGNFDGYKDTQLDSNKYADVFSIQCNNCVHYESGHVCPAFPSGIPPAIWDNEVKHDKPLPGDGGIIFEFIGGA